MLGSLYRIQRKRQLGLLTTEQEQSLSSLTIQQLASISRVDKNQTFSFALVFYLSSGSGKAFPTDQCLLPFLQQTLSTLIVESLFKEQVATVLSQFLSKQQGMTACQCQAPRYLATSTNGTVLGGSCVRLDRDSADSGKALQPIRAADKAIRIRMDLFIRLSQIRYNSDRYKAKNKK